MSNNFNILEAPLLLHKLSLMRAENTPSAEFRRLLREIGALVALEVTRDFPTLSKKIRTPLETIEAPFLDMASISLVAVLRAGYGLLDGMLDSLPTATVGHIGLYRDPTTLEAIQYYCKLPSNVSGGDCLIVDPMLATGHSAIAAVREVTKHNPKRIIYISLVAAPEGVQAFCSACPEVKLYTVALDRELNDHGYILPGLGDAGDRLYGTK